MKSVLSLFVSMVMVATTFGTATYRASGTTTGVYRPAGASLLFTDATTGQSEPIEGELPSYIYGVTNAWTFADYPDGTAATSLPNVTYVGWEDSSVVRTSEEWQDTVLELSTEGGELWFSVNSPTPGERLGTPFTLGRGEGFQVRAQVAFTPTEDGVPEPTPWTTTLPRLQALRPTQGIFPGRLVVVVSAGTFLAVDDKMGIVARVDDLGTTNYCLCVKTPDVENGFRYVNYVLEGAVSACDRFVDMAFDLTVDGEGKLFVTVTCDGERLSCSGVEAFPVYVAEGECPSVSGLMARGCGAFQSLEFSCRTHPFTAKGFVGSYDGEGHGLEVSGSSAFGSCTVAYALAETGPWQSDLLFTNVFSHKVYAQLTFDAYLPLILSDQVTIARATNEWTVTPTLAGWMYGAMPAEPVAAAQFGEVAVTYSSGEKPTVPGNYTATFTVAETENYAGLSATVPFTIAQTAAQKAVQDSLIGVGTVVSDGEGWKVVVTNASVGTLDLPDNLGPVTIDLSGWILTGADGTAGSATVPGGIGTPAVRIVASGEAGAPTVVTFVNSGNEGGLIVGGAGGAGNPPGDGAAAIVITDEARAGVLVNIGKDVTVVDGVGGMFETGRSSATTHLALDTRTGTRYASVEEPITFSTDWNAGTTRLVLNVDGVNVLTATTATNGVYVWKPDFSTVRTVTVKHTTRGTVNEALTATFTTAAYDVTFDAGAHGVFSGDGAVVQRVPHGEAATAPMVVPATGYRFTGWSVDTSHVTGSFTTTAQYEAIPYTITYEDLYGATHGNPSTYTVEDAVTFTAPGSIPCRQFVRWEPASIAAGSTGAVTVRAIWETTPCVYVDAVQGNDAQDGSLADQAVKTLARAYELAEPGDVILVAAGTYGPVTATGKAVTFRGADGATIDGGGTDRCVTADADVVFENFTIQNGYDAEAGGGVYGGTFERCTIRDCVSEWDGGGAYEATLRNCVIVGNEAVNGWGGGAYGGTLDHCVVKDNVAGDEGGGVYEPVSLSDTTLSGNLPEDTTDVGGIVTVGGSSVYVPSGSSTIHSIPHDWLMAAGLMKAGESTAGLDAKLAAPYADGYTGWEAFVAGLTARDQTFRAEIEMVDGEVRISWTPNLNTGAVNRIYAVLGRTDLDKSDWETPVQPWHRFFKVTVAMPTGAADERSAVAGEGFVPQPEPELGGVQLWENGPYWAECNVGASKPEEYGYYFWWGDTVGYMRSGGTWTSDYYYSGVTWVSSTGTRMSSSPFSSSSCPTYNKSNSTLQSQGYIDSTGNLVAKYDAATAHLGAPWRMPTDAEFLALISNCTTTWTTRNGVYGRLVTGKGAYASKSIFLPAAGCGYDSDLSNPGSYGVCWSSSPNSGNSCFAWYLNFLSDYFGRGCYGDCRYDGFPVRPLRGFAK